MNDKELIEYYGQDTFILNLCKQYGKQVFIPLLKLKQEILRRQREIFRYNSQAKHNERI